MAVLNFSARILSGKFDQWKSFHDEFEAGGAHRADWEDQMRRYGITIASLDDTMLLSYVADAGTGKLERKAHTKPAEPRPAAPQADAAAPTKPETKEG